MQSIWFRYLSGLDVDALAITSREVVDAVEAVVLAHGNGETVFEPRTHLVPDNGGVGHFNVLRGSVTSLGERGVAGVKVVGDFVPNHLQGLPSELAMMTLFDPTTGVPLAVMDATFVTEARTGAMTAVGARHLGRPDAKVLGHIGARGTAFSNVTMLDAMLDLDEIRVTSKREESREAFAEQLRAATDTPVRAVATAEEALVGADIMVEASRLETPTPLLRTAWVEPGTFVVPYGTVSAVEADLVDVMDKVVVDDWREARAGRFGALRAHVDSGALSEATLHAELGEVVAGRKAGRESADERILFWHRGLSVLDIALGHLILRRAEAAEAAGAAEGAGTMLRYR